MRIEADTDSLIILKDKAESLCGEIKESFASLTRDGNFDAEDNATKEFFEAAEKIIVNLDKLADGVKNDVAKRTELVNIYNGAAYGRSL